MKRKKEENKTAARARAQGKSRVSPQRGPCIMHAMEAAGCMQSGGTDGLVGGWVLSTHRSSCGSAVPLLFITQARTGHVRHVPRIDAHRLNRGQYAYCALLAIENTGMFTLEFHSLLGTLRGFKKAKCGARCLWFEQQWIV